MCVCVCVLMKYVAVRDARRRTSLDGLFGAIINPALGVAMIVCDGKNFGRDSGDN